MEFWFFFYSMILLFLLCNFVLPNRIKKEYMYLVILFLWVIAAFRYQIGTDYSAYAEWFRAGPANFDDVIWTYFYDPDNEREFMFLTMIWIIKSFDLNEQFMFVVIESIIVFFVYKGFRFYLVKYDRIALAFLLYAVIDVPGGYFYSLNGMRQSMAMAIVFFASTYYVRKKFFTYLMFIFLASLFHTSAVIALLVPVLAKVTMSKKKMFGFIFTAVLFNLTLLPPKILMIILKNAPFYGERYGEVIGSVNLDFASHIGIGLMLAALIFLIVVLENKYGKDVGWWEKCFSIAVLYVTMYIFVAYSIIVPPAAGIFSIWADVVTSLFHRVDAYFFLFYVIYMIHAVKERIVFKNGVLKTMLCMSVVFVLFSMQSVRSMYHIQQNTISTNLESQGNYNYKFNFDIFLR